MEAVLGRPECLWRRADIRSYVRGRYVVELRCLFSEDCSKRQNGYICILLNITLRNRCVRQFGKHSDGLWAIGGSAGPDRRSLINKKTVRAQETRLHVLIVRRLACDVVFVSCGVTGGTARTVTHLPPGQLSLITGDGLRWGEVRADASLWSANGAKTRECLPAT